MAFPSEGDYAPYYKKYIDKVKGDTIADIIRNHSEDIFFYYNNIPEDKAGYAYAEGKWTVKDVLQHVIDAERVFSYRAMRISRNDSTPLPGFDENEYAKYSGASARSLSSLKEELAAVRNATDLLLQSFTEEQLAIKGTASDQPVTVNALAYIIYGHLIHHKNILEERYGVR